MAPGRGRGRQKALYGSAKASVDLGQRDRDFRSTWLSRLPAEGLVPQRGGLPRKGRIRGCEAPTAVKGRGEQGSSLERNATPTIKKSQSEERLGDDRKKASPTRRRLEAARGSRGKEPILMPEATMRANQEETLVCMNCGSERRSRLSGLCEPCGCEMVSTCAKGDEERGSDQKALERLEKHRARERIDFLPIGCLLRCVRDELREKARTEKLSALLGFVRARCDRTGDDRVRQLAKELAEECLEAARGSDLVRDRKLCSDALDLMSQAAPELMEDELGLQMRLVLQEEREGEEDSELAGRRSQASFLLKLFDSSSGRFSEKTREVASSLRGMERVFDPSAILEVGCDFGAGTVTPEGEATFGS